MAIMLEYSTLFLNYRTMLYREEWNKNIGVITQLGFFLTFTVFRVMLMPLVCYKVTRGMIIIWGYSSTYSDLLMCLTFFLLLSLFVLNYYWYALILKGMYKMLAGGSTKVSVIEENQDSDRERNGETETPKPKNSDLEGNYTKVN